MLDTHETAQRKQSPFLEYTYRQPPYDSYSTQTEGEAHGLYHGWEVGVAYPEDMV